MPSGEIMLEYILVSYKGDYTVASLSWDNNWCHPDFSTVGANKDHALSNLFASIEADGRLRKYDVKSLPVHERHLTKRAGDVCQRHAFWKSSTKYSICPDCGFCLGTHA